MLVLPTLKGAAGIGVASSGILTALHSSKSENAIKKHYPQEFKTKKMKKSTSVNNNNVNTRSRNTREAEVKKSVSSETVNKNKGTANFRGKKSSNSGRNNWGSLFGSMSRFGNVFGYGVSYL